MEESKGGDLKSQVEELKRELEEKTSILSSIEGLVEQVPTTISKIMERRPPSGFYYVKILDNVVRLYFLVEPDGKLWLRG
jgi:hypothetical protein